jgi:hypothetical protein
MWTMLQFNADKARLFDAEVRKAENKGLKEHLGQLSDAAMLIALAQCKVGNTAEWKGFDAGLYAEHRGAAGNFISCQGKHFHLKVRATKKRGKEEASEEVLLCQLREEELAPTGLLAR